MKKFFLILIFCIFAMVKVVWAQSSDTDPCKSIRYEPELNLTTSYGKLNYDHSYSQNNLRELGKTFGIGEQGMFTAGLSIASIEWEVMLNTMSRVTETGNICVVPTVVDVFIGYQNPTIYISNNFKQGSCEYNLVLRHEHQHQQINIIALEYFIPKIRSELQRRLKEVQPRLSPDLEKAEAITAQLTDEYIETIEPYVNKFKASMLKEQAQLDTRQNYELESKICRKDLLGKLGL